MAGGPAFISGNVQAAFHLIADRVLEGKAKELKDISPGDAAVITAKGEQIAVCRRSDGSFHALSAVCTHMGCIVDWNQVDRTWDCPCHGSRFTAEGEVLAGPAVSPLAPRSLGEAGEEHSRTDEG
ncbi:MAG: Rieske 2Fe-2S domain-containing protein, partial [Nitratireductor sp.]|nr:Rieske 2Fe-2S domain-containing protein [Nitratireductor sp.]